MLILASQPYLHQTMLHNPGTISLPLYNMTRHPIETWQEWYISNQSVIDVQLHITNQIDIYGSSVVDDPAFEIRNIAPYEYIDSLNQRQIWEPYLTGRERQEFDTHLRVCIVIVIVIFVKTKSKSFEACVVFD